MKNGRKMLLWIFNSEIVKQCKFAFIAKDEIEKSLLGGKTDKLWYSIQSLLSAAGNISKILWPPNERYRQRGEELRKRLSIQDSSPLQPRKFRNHFEHFDERLEKWAISSRRHNIIDSCIGPSVGGADEKDYFRNFHPDNWMLSFRGDKYQLKPLINEIKELCNKALVEATKHWGK